MAVIDSGIDILHEDLKDVIWINEDEIPDNGIDDDNNGFVDDIYGWNFIGGKDGKNVDKDSYELAREYKRLLAKYEGKTAGDFKKKERAEFEYWAEIKAEYEKSREETLLIPVLILSPSSIWVKYPNLFNSKAMLDAKVVFPDPDNPVIQITIAR